MEYRKAKLEDLDAVEEFYGLVIDNMQQSPYSPGWTRGVYPTREMLKAFIEEDAMTIGLEDDTILSAFNLNTTEVDDWKYGHWTKHDKKDISALHSLAVRPVVQRKGLGLEAVKEAIAVSRREGFKTIRLDVAAHNLIARKMYEKAGFHFLGTITMEYAVAGRIPYALYEYEIQ